ncbi:cold shock domain-containing protein [Halomonas piscis]|uniref:Cold shock domain-containing protein n=1 Tax=Halomonas piscis TaxID=3031727 RepID=A0ABY9Z2C6_9GAMM|nr:cold shock domain-containing protein [Halomonas piscis]WNK20755.1 cold shock domain-containing protein [Halomonas piscis]
MKPKVVLRCILISLLLAAPAPFLLTGIFQLVSAPLINEWVAELALVGGAGVYFATALGCFVLLCVGTVTAAALAPPMVVRAPAAPVKEAASPAPEPVEEEEVDHEDNVIDPDDGREEGDVKWFNTNKGYGFITRDSGEDVFVHFRAIRGRGPRMLHEGQVVRYQVIRNERGLQADDVSIIE